MNYVIVSSFSLLNFIKIYVKLSEVVVVVVVVVVFFVAVVVVSRERMRSPIEILC